MYLLTHLMFISIAIAVAEERVLATICEFNAHSLSCQDGKVLKVSEANYGRTEARNSICDDRNHQTTNCILSTSLDVVQATCQGQIQCTLHANNFFFGADPCPNIFKYLVVTYSCILPAYRSTSMLAESTAAQKMSSTLSTPTTHHPSQEHRSTEVDTYYQGTTISTDCSCPEEITFSYNMSITKELKEHLEEIARNIAIDKTQTSIKIRKYVCAGDERPSSKMIGSVLGYGILVSLGAMIVLFDLSNICFNCRDKY